MRKSVSEQGSSRGFTVIEVVIAAFLLAAGLIATAQLAVMATGQVSLSRQQSDGSRVAAQTIEQYRDVGFYTLAAGTYNASQTVGATTYTVQTVVTVDTPQVGLKTVVVTVTWPGGQSYATSTILSPLQ
jgi:Tfp pilus assembly protein PilV